MTRQLIAFFVVLALAAPTWGVETEEERFERLRAEMVALQIEARGVKDPRVLRAMRAVRRHEFVPEPFRAIAYNDSPLPIGEGQTISQPYIVAFMTEMAEVKKGEKVLEIGTGSGYQAAVLAEMTPNVYTIELLAPLADRAAETLRRLGYEQVQTRTGDGYKGWPEEQPFDAILVTAAAEKIPQPLVDQLAEGGVLVIPVGPRGSVQELTRLRKENGKLNSETLIPVQFVPLVRKEE